MSYVMPPTAHSPHEVGYSREDTKSSTSQESTVFNKPEDSDIIIEYHGVKVYAHRAILRMCSPFFERILQSQWPVAKGPVFSLGDDDDPVVVDAMLRHMYNLSYSPSKFKNVSKLLKLHIDVFMLADKYDCPSLRRAAASNFHDAADKALDIGMPTFLMKTIPAICGPDACQTADLSLRDTLLSFCATHYARLFRFDIFRDALRDGKLFDVDATTKLLEKVGAIALPKQANSRPRRVLPPRAFSPPVLEDDGDEVSVTGVQL
ncbi:hypothetical protein KCU99_g739, partial [Aureobasidium melanogenum]